MITATAIGNIVRDPETRQTQSGSVTNVTVAVNRKRGGEESATFIRCAIWGKRGESFAEYHSKGDRAALSGDLYIRQYTDKDGNQRESLEMDVQNFTFVKSGGGGEQRNATRRAEEPLTKQGNVFAGGGGRNAYDNDHPDIPF